MSVATRADWFGLAALTGMYGTAFLFIRKAVEGLAPLSVASGRIVTAALVLGLALRASGLALPRDPARWVWFAVLALIGNALPFFLISWGQEQVQSGLAGILMAINPLATLVLAHGFGGADERLTSRRALGFALGFLGVVLIIGPGALFELGGDASQALRQNAILGGACCYALNSVLVRRMPATHPLVSSAAVLALAGLWIVPAAWLLDRPFAGSPGWDSLGCVVWLGLVPTATATIVYFRVIGTAGPTFVSLVNFPVPLVAVFAGALVYGERLEAHVLLALALILAGLALGQPRARVS